MTNAAPRPAALLVSALLGLGVLALAALAGLVFLRAPAEAAVLAVGACACVAALRRPDLAIYAVLFLLYSNLPAVGVAFHGVPKLVAAAFPLLLAVPLVRDLVLERRSLVLTPAFVLLVLLFAVQVAGTVGAIEPARAFDGLVTFALEGLVLYLLVTNVLRTRAQLVGATWTLLAAGVLMSIVPLVQQVTGTFGNSYGGLAQVDGGAGFATGEVAEEGGVEETQPRLAGPIGEKNRYAQVLLLLLPLGILRCFGAPTRAGRMLALAVTGTIAFAFVLPFSRGGAVGLAAVLATMVALRLIDLRKALAVAVASGLLLAAMPQYWKRIESVATTISALEGDAGVSGADGAVRRRLTSMLAAARVFLDHPLVGVGPGQFKAYSAQYGNEGGFRRIEGGRRAHNLYLEIAAETGALGLAFFLAAIGVTLVGLNAARRACLAHEPELAELATAYLLALVAYLTTGLFLHLSYMRYFYLLLALGGAVAEVALRTAGARRAAPQPVLVPVGGGA